MVPTITDDVDLIAIILQTYISCVISTQGKLLIVTVIAELGDLVSY